MSSTRRIIFTALAVAAFWVLAVRGYWFASDLWHEFAAYSGNLDRTTESMGGLDWFLLPLVGLSLALIPTAFVHTSTENRILSKPEPWVRLAGVGFVCACGFCYWLGEHDAENAYAAVAPIMIMDPNHPEYGAHPDYAAQHLAARQAHQVSWFWLLLPIILTTTFVIFGAWRWAVQDAEADAVGEDAEE